MGWISTRGETLEAIARRASEAAKKDAELGAVAGLAVDGSAVTEAGFVSRVEEVKSGGKVLVGGRGNAR